ncbi:hypothetical protein U1Q18_018471 [Sarracenia purpurea var. burkii]
MHEISFIHLNRLKADEYSKLAGIDSDFDLCSRHTFSMPNETRGPTSPRYLQLSTHPSRVWGPCCSLVPARRWPVALQAAALREEKGEAEAHLSLSPGESKPARCSHKLKAQNPVVPSLTGLQTGGDFLPLRLQVRRRRFPPSVSSRALFAEGKEKREYPKLIGNKAEKTASFHSMKF